MTSIQRRPASLTSLDVAFAALLRPLAPVAPVELPLAVALNCVVADMPPLQPLPSRDLAAADGWALRASDLVGASSYSPLPLSTPPVWVEAGDPLPDQCDCVVDADVVEQAGPLLQVLAEATPGQGVRRAGSDVAGGTAVIQQGRRIGPRDLLLARRAGLQQLKVRRPRLCILNTSAPWGAAETVHLMAENARAEGAEVVQSEARGRDIDAITQALDVYKDHLATCDLLLTIGGTGVGRTDATVAALAKGGEISAHGIALHPGRTAAVGKWGETPFVALPGAPDQAMAVWWTMALPALDRLSGRLPRPTLALRLRQKIASHIGLAEIALLSRTHEGWTPLAVGDLSLSAIAHADAWLLVSAASEGFAAGTPVDAYILRD